MSTKLLINIEMKILIIKNIKYRLLHKNLTKYGGTYRNIRKTVKSTMRIPKDEYYINKIQENNSSCTGMWKIVNNVLNCNPSDGCDTSDSSLTLESTQQIHLIRILVEPSVDEMKFGSVNEDTIRNIVIPLKNSSSGYDEIPIEFIKNIFICFDQLHNNQNLQWQFPVNCPLPKSSLFSRLEVES